jgi:hypothetical protein
MRVLLGAALFSLYAIVILSSDGSAAEDASATKAMPPKQR